MFWSVVHVTVALFVVVVAEMDEIIGVVVAVFVAEVVVPVAVAVFVLVAAVLVPVFDVFDVLVAFVLVAVPSVLVAVCAETTNVEEINSPASARKARNFFVRKRENIFFPIMFSF